MSDETKMPEAIHLTPNGGMPLVSFGKTAPPNSTRCVRADLPADVAEAVERLADELDDSGEAAVLHTDQQLADLRTILDHLKQQEPADAD